MHSYINNMLFWFITMLSTIPFITPSNFFFNDFMLRFCLITQPTHKTFQDMFDQRELGFGADLWLVERIIFPFV